MLPAQAWEPGKVAIGRDERRIVLERERGKIRVLDEIAAAIGTAAEIAKDVEVCSHACVGSIRWTTAARAPIRPERSGQVDFRICRIGSGKSFVPSFQHAWHAGQS